MSQPNLSKLVLVEVDLHAHEIVPVGLLQVKPDDVTHFYAVLQGPRLLQLIVVAKRCPIELDLAVEGHFSEFLRFFW